MNSKTNSAAVDLANAASPRIPVELAGVAAALKRFHVCAEDSCSEGCDIGRNWFDALTTLGLLVRTQRSPGIWTMTAAGERLLSIVELLDQQSVAIPVDDTQGVAPPAVGAHEVHSEVVNVRLDPTEVRELGAATDAFVHGPGVRQQDDQGVTPSPAGQGDALPPLPLPNYPVSKTGLQNNAYTASQMQDYARAALAARQPVGQEPVAATRLFPEVLGSTASPDARRVLVTGFDVGPFFVHMGISDDESTHFSDKVEDMELWHVTHRASGFATQKRIPTHTRAIWLAQQLLEFDVWDSSDRDTVLAALTREQMMQIEVLRADAVSGDCQGQKMALIDGQAGVGRG